MCVCACVYVCAKQGYAVSELFLQKIWIRLKGKYNANYRWLWLVIRKSGEDLSEGIKIILKWGNLGGREVLLKHSLKHLPEVGKLSNVVQSIPAGLSHAFVSVRNSEVPLSPCPLALLLCSSQLDSLQPTSFSSPLPHLKSKNSTLSTKYCPHN